jgi:prefoldin subunit 5
MKAVLQQRLHELKAEHDNGQRLLADLEARRESLRTTLLRIGGAIQVLEELLHAETATEPQPAITVAALTHAH